MSIRRTLLIAVALLVALTPATPAAAQGAMAESAKPNSSISVAVEPALSDGRLIVKIAAQNRSAAAVPFGPASVAIAKAGGASIPTIPLAKLIEDVRFAAGAVAPPAGGVPSSSAYSAPQLNVRDGRVDPTGYTGGSTIGRDEVIRRTGRRADGKKPSLSMDEANRQIAALQLAILQDKLLQPRQVAAGQVVSEPLKFKKGEDRTIHLWVRIAGDEHSFTLAAPGK